jgi:hypothetical protein
MAATPEKILSDAALAVEVGISAGVLGLARKAGQILDDPIPNYCTARDVKAWLRRWPQFVAADWVGQRWADRLDKYNAANRRARLVDKFGAKPSTNARQTPSPATPAHPPAPAGKSPSPGNSDDSSVATAA